MDIVDRCFSMLVASGLVCGQDVNTGETYEFHNPDKIIEEGIDFV